MYVSFIESLLFGNYFPSVIVRGGTIKEFSIFSSYFNLSTPPLFCEGFEKIWPHLLLQSPPPTTSHLKKGISFPENGIALRIKDFCFYGENTQKGGSKIKKGQTPLQISII